MTLIEVLNKSHFGQTIVIYDFTDTAKERSVKLTSDDIQKQFKKWTLNMPFNANVLSLHATKSNCLNVAVDYSTSGVKM